MMNFEIVEGYCEICGEKEQIITWIVDPEKDHISRICWGCINRMYGFFKGKRVEK